jgi:hypothetical protein
MSTLLVLGSKPGPILPPGGSFDALACANASGNSAARLGLGTPRLTAISAIVTSGHKPANDLAVKALAGLRTEVLYFYPRAPAKGGLLRLSMSYIKNMRMKPWYFRYRLRAAGYRWDEFHDPGLAAYQAMFQRWCDGEPGIMEQIARKQPSTGLLALLLGIDSGTYSRFILSGFSFEITHAYAENPLVAVRGTQSLHADTDIAILSHLQRKLGTIYTTEPTVQQQTGVPLLATLSPADQ